MLAPAVRRSAVPLLLVLLSLLNGCDTRPAGERVVRRSFYYWRGTFRLTPAELAALRGLDVARLYVRLFDVALDRPRRRPKPVGVLSMAQRAPEGIEVVPTVFITNEVIGALGTGAADTLAGNIVAKIRAMLPALGVGRAAEVQIDCDWTSSTRPRYFELLRAIDSAAKAVDAGWRISATIRLHQVRDRHSTGVPPVDRGMLMVYNTGNPTDPTLANAIFDTADIRGYLRALPDYPLPLDVALPLFSWGVVFHEGSFFLLLNNLRRADLERPGVTKLADGRYRLDGDLYIDGRHLFAGDVIRLEEVDAAGRAAIASLISSTLPADSVSVALYHLDPSILANHASADLSALYGAFR